MDRRRRLRHLCACLFDAVKNADDIYVRLILAQGASPNIKDSRGWTPLHWAAIHPRRAIVLNTLLGSGARVNIRCSRTGKTPLHVAAEAGNLPAVKYLLNHGASLTVRDSADRTPSAAARVPTALQRITRKPTAKRFLENFERMLRCDEESDQHQTDTRVPQQQAGQPTASSQEGALPATSPTTAASTNQAIQHTQLTHHIQQQQQQLQQQAVLAPTPRRQVQVARARTSLGASGGNNDNNDNSSSDNDDDDDDDDADDNDEGESASTADTGRNSSTCAPARSVTSECGGDGDMDEAGNCGGDDEHQHMQHKQQTLTPLQAELGDALRCSVCSHLLVDPVTLPCGHALCAGCCQRLMRTSSLRRSGRGRKFACPLDNSKFSRDMALSISVQLRTVLSILSRST
ncbi:hypothetical protein PTSG_09665 [Salpingoeca rosetta]|uniref:RING-type domain-containing protein n=1 Tax=Salpingoeca rosetta (strain ATCC 50818 / BSB-021) TaxID=946362 RepID=F2ULM9_SALR5|nr:uncharacterized protein PTSG_09665 [Salpingoeca rosetta]EGD78028.1 hypothetical protein PTSG_09665 [Salpingoeca rosetta]|eukprot:XP_004990090.1 hypothetical protein PTSG_09665 [Salpingoeca rosetta]